MTTDATKTKRTSMRGMGRVFQRGSVWWVDYHHSGQKIRETSRSTKRADAIALLKRRHEELGKGLVMQDAQRITLADFKALIRADYALENRRSEKRLLASWLQLAAYFGEAERASRRTIGPQVAHGVIRDQRPKPTKPA